MLAIISSSYYPGPNSKLCICKPDVFTWTHFTCFIEIYTILTCERFCNFHFSFFFWKCKQSLDIHYKLLYWLGGLNHEAWYFFFCQGLFIHYSKARTPKGQVISKGFFGVFNFFQKTNKNTSHSRKNEFIPLFFGRIHGLTICFWYNWP